MQEAVNGVLAYAFGDLKVSSIYALSASPNIGGTKLQEKGGFYKVGEIPNRTWIDDSKMSLVQSRITTSDY